MARPRTFASVTSPDILLQLLADKLPTFGNLTVAAAFRRFGQFSRTEFPRNVVADDSFRALMARARYGHAHNARHVIDTKLNPHFLS